MLTSKQERGEHHGRGGHGGGGHGGHHGGEEGGKREELRHDEPAIHHDRKDMRAADNPQEKREAEQAMKEDQQDLKKDWGPGEPKHAGEAHHHGGGGGGRGEHEGRGVSLSEQELRLHELIRISETGPWRTPPGGISPQYNCLDDYGITTNVGRVYPWKSKLICQKS